MQTQLYDLYLESSCKGNTAAGVGETSVKLECESLYTCESKTESMW